MGTRTVKIGPKYRKSKPIVIAIVGPTAVGKSDFAVEIARAVDGEIISADSRQVYRDLDLGSGKITKREMRGVPHHLLDIASPKRAYSVARFQRDGSNAIARILKWHKAPVVVGGTGFYVDALLLDMKFPNVKPNYALRKKLERLPTDALVRRLKQLDPRRSKEIDQKNRVRLIRAIEIATLYGPIRPLTTTSPYEVLWVGLSCKAETLKERIALRLKKRIRAGMLKEFERLHDNGLSYRRMEALGLEYRYGAWLLRGEIGRMKFEERLAREIFRYAKRQMTWFKRNASIRWFDISETKNALQYVLSRLEQGDHKGDR